MANPEARLLVDALLAARNMPAAIAQNDHAGPIFPLYSINFTNLPAGIHQKTKDLIVDLNGTAGVVDKGPKAERNNGTIGAMRQIHANVPHYLPTVDTGGLSGRAKVYEAYVTANKSHTNDREGGNDSTGYVEYTAGDNEMYRYAHLSEMRVVFNYVTGLLYLTPFHYQSWELDGANGLNVIDKPQVGSGRPNPWFWIIEISKKL